MSPELKQALTDRLLAFADDELILAHRDSEWTGHGPILEEDIAFANIAQDELGHATLWYGIIHSLTGEYPDRLVFHREADAYRNIQMVELPNGDWAFSMLRQYLFDAAEMIRLAALKKSSFQPIRDAAGKIWPEEIYHFRHTQNWVKRLGLGTEESHRRMQRALETLWPVSQQQFASLPHEELLVSEGIVPPPDDLRRQWLDLVQSHLSGSGLIVPELGSAPPPRTQHTVHLTSLLAEMQMVPRLFPESDW